MRVRSVTRADRSHSLPMVPLARALSAAGHEAQAVGTPALAGPGLSAHAAPDGGGVLAADTAAALGGLTTDLPREGVRRLGHQPSFRTGTERPRAENLARPGPHDLAPVPERRTAERRR
ncbi:hypothetical protein [Streptomyces malaysiensis]|uniref:hypothetical protein n=1 Tax=Streptomyces malaysiensis TaxID=92644 RepID=UPI000BFF374B|nr:hypothetical protein [Streptomyces malaysiensis]ATL87980.1 glycosyl transferase, NDP-D-desosamine: 3-L-mycarosyl erythronolide B [Streptomyces malaysiensis]